MPPKPRTLDDIDDLPPGFTDFAAGRGPLGDLIDRAPHAAAAPFRGLWVILRALAYWLTDHEGRTERRALTGGDQAAQRLAVQRQHRDDMLTRAKWAGGALAVLTLTLLVALPRFNDVQRAILAAGVFVALCILGRAHRDTTAPRTDATGGRTFDHVAQALAAAVPKVATDDVASIKPARATPAGWAIDVALPLGVPAADAMARRDAIASGLRTPAEQLIIERGPRHEGHLVVTALDAPLRDQPRPANPYTDAPRVDIFDGIELGTTVAGTPVRVPLVYESGVFGAQPRTGKSAALRHILTAAALDPRVELHVHTWKGGRDFLPLAPVATYLRSGSDAEDLTAARDDLTRLHTDMARRYRVLEGLDDDRCPDGQVTTQLASDPALGLHPVVIAWDETQIPFALDPTLAGMVEDLVRRGPAVGFTVLLATQRPDAVSIPTAISANLSTRLCFAVDTQFANDTTLGVGSHKAGITATSFTVADKGIGWLRSSLADRPAIIRTHYLDLPATARVVEVAASRRDAEGRALMPVTVDDDVPVIFADQLLEVWPGTTAGLHLTEVAALLDLTADEVRDLAAAEGIPVTKVSRRINGTPTSRHGIRYDALVPAEQALTA